MDDLPIVSDEAHIQQAALILEQSLLSLNVIGLDDDDDDVNDKDKGNPDKNVEPLEKEDKVSATGNKKEETEKQGLLTESSAASSNTTRHATSAIVRSLYDRKESPSLRKVLDDDTHSPPSTKSDSKKTDGARDGSATKTQADQDKAFRQGERHAIRLVLEEVDRLAAEKMKTGFHETNFTVGVMNSLVIAFVFGAYPQHFWLLYLVEALFFIPMKFRVEYNAKPLCGILFFLDYCWVMNITGMGVVMALLADSFIPFEFVSHTTRMQVFLAFLGTTTGPLLYATVLLPFVAVVFHDLATMANLFIHLIPPMVGFTLRWHWDAIREAWPDVFALDYMEQVTFFPTPGDSFFFGHSVVGNTMALYWAWFIPYFLWQTFVGLRLPRSRPDDPPAKYDTAYHAAQRAFMCKVMGKVFWKRSKQVSQGQIDTNDFEYRDFVAYMIGHAVTIHLAIVLLAFWSFESLPGHGFLLLLTAMVCVYRGAKRYTYYTTAMYGRTIRRQFAEIIEREGLE